jgi:hypothetical protein
LKIEFRKTGGSRALAIALIHAFVLPKVLSTIGSDAAFSHWSARAKVEINKISKLIMTLYRSVGPANEASFAFVYK